MNTTENNKLIADFMGITFEANRFKPYEDVNGWRYEELKFHEDWNWLMSVIEKILDISLSLDSMEMYYNITDYIPNISQTYIAVTDFIKWYNENSR